MKLKSNTKKFEEEKKRNEANRNGNIDGERIKTEEDENYQKN